MSTEETGPIISQRCVRMTPYQAALYCGLSHRLRQGEIRHLASVERYSEATDQSWIVHSFVELRSGKTRRWAHDLDTGDVVESDWHGNELPATHS